MNPDRRFALFEDVEKERPMSGAENSTIGAFVLVRLLNRRDDGTMVHPVFMPGRAEPIERALIEHRDWRYRRMGWYYTVCARCPGCRGPHSRLKAASVAAL
jgi:hypothetical protein